MKRFLIIGALALAGCGGEVPGAPGGPETAPTDDLLARAAADEYRRTHYEQPNFEEQQVFRVRSQTGCEFWITSGHKFDSTYVVLTEDGVPSCPEGVTPPSPEHW